MRIRRWLLQATPAHRWYFDKDRTATGAEFVWREQLPGTGGGIELSVVEFTFSSGPPSLYFMVLGTDPPRDLIGEQRFTRWLVDSLAGTAELPPGLRWERIGNGLPVKTNRDSGQLLRFEQSNSSIRFGDTLITKINRRLTIGPSPESELIPVIAKAADRSFAPETYGLLWLTGVTDEPICVGICAQFIPNLGDGWGYWLDHLDTDDGEKLEIEAAEVGRVTAHMHTGLISDPWRTDLAPEAIREADTDGWTETAAAELSQLAAALVDRLDTLTGEARELAVLLPAALPALHGQLAGFGALVGTSRIRIHGDYHLGQILRTAKGRYVVVDFDGEPNRSLAERRSKYAALRDVAGMLRSFTYLRGTAIRKDDSVSNLEWLERERRWREAFLVGYFADLDQAGFALVPRAEDDVRLALTALELEKAIYECEYELNARPDWLALPLSRLVKAG